MTASIGLTVAPPAPADQTLIIDTDRLVETRMLLQANSGAGKSWALRRILEQTHGRGVQQLVLDPDGEFHTLREKLDYVLAGPGGDCAADLRGAGLLARKLLELGTSAIINIYELGARRPEFVRAFLDSLMSAPRALWHPAIVVIDEAHMFAPEAGKSASAEAVIDLMSRGRKRGFAGILATQRIAKLHKDAAAEANNKLIGRSSLDIDMKRSAAELGMTSREDMQAIRSMPDGEFFAFGPALYLQGRRGTHGVVRVKVGPVETTHLRAGQRAAPPPPPKDKIRKVLAQLADLPHEAEEEARDVTTLRAQNAELKRQLAAKVETPAAKLETKIVERSLVKPAELARIEKLAARADKSVEYLAAVSDRVTTAIKAAAELASGAGMKLEIELAKLRAAIAPAPAVVIPAAAPVAHRPPRHEAGEHAPPARQRAAAPSTSTGRQPAAQRVLDTLALLETYGITPTREVLAAWLGVGPRQPAFHRNLGTLRTAGLVDGFGLTTEGRAAANAITPPTQEEARASILSAVQPAARKIVEVLLAANRPLTRAELAEKIGVGERQPALHRNLGMLRTRQIVTKDWPIAAGRVLFLDGGAA